jgi:hypothetical protein
VSDKYLFVPVLIGHPHRGKYMKKSGTVKGFLTNVRVGGQKVRVKITTIVTIGNNRKVKYYFP